MLPPWGPSTEDLLRMHEERCQRLMAAQSVDLGAAVVRLARAIAEQAAVAVGRLERARTRANVERGRIATTSACRPLSAESGTAMNHLRGDRSRG